MIKNKVSLMVSENILEVVHVGIPEKGLVLARFTGERLNTRFGEFDLGCLRHCLPL